MRRATQAGRRHATVMQKARAAAARSRSRVVRIRPILEATYRQAPAAMPIVARFQLASLLAAAAVFAVFGAAWAAPLQSSTGASACCPRRRSGRYAGSVLKTNGALEEAVHQTKRMQQPQLPPRDSDVPRHPHSFWPSNGAAEARRAAITSGASDPAAAILAVAATEQEGNRRAGDAWAWKSWAAPSYTQISMSPPCRCLDAVSTALLQPLGAREKQPLQRLPLLPLRRMVWWCLKHAGCSYKNSRGAAQEGGQRQRCEDRLKTIRF
ncbi:hypothetical protein cyc_08303 [Cyclospora cayetanensis]|uniref:Uncharacterized protein n=1 Tax=Cyclospora cayetanensis TaxID=88456 RepID=A0A1D3D6E2_9EIME|nr:hypothetical protein cyc_08303 [Cyclospora cayetanensis]